MIEKLKEKFKALWSNKWVKIGFFVVIGGIGLLILMAIVRFFRRRSAIRLGAGASSATSGIGLMSNRESRAQMRAAKAARYEAVTEEKVERQAARTDKVLRRVDKRSQKDELKAARQTLKGKDKRKKKREIRARYANKAQERSLKRA